MSANSFVVSATHPVHGTYLRHGPLVVFDNESPDLKGPPSAGQHNEEVLLEMGYDAEEITRLLQDGTL